MGCTCGMPRPEKSLSTLAADFHLVSVPVATKMGLNGTNVVTITAEQYDKVTKGSDYFPEGMLLQNAQTGEIVMYSNGQRQLISVPVANAMNITAAQVTTIAPANSTKFPRVPITSHRVFISRIR